VPYLTLEFDAAFRDYNFASHRDPGFPAQVSVAELRIMLDVLDSDETAGAADIADVFSTTLRNGTLEGFQRLHGPKPIDYRDWCLAKTGQFFGILGIGWDPEAVLNGKSPVSYLSFPWAEIVLATRRPYHEAEKALTELLRDWRGDDLIRGVKTPGWGKNRERDGILIAMRDRGASNEEIVKELDLRAITGLPCMKSRGVVRWVEAYNDVYLMQRIDQFIGKAYVRRTAVK
jgi:hypothetical protein